MLLSFQTSQITKQQCLAGLLLYHLPSPTSQKDKKGQKQSFCPTYNPQYSPSSLIQVMSYLSEMEVDSKQ